MKKSILAVVVAVLLTAITMSIFQQRLDNQRLTKNVYALFGQGDEGEEFNYALLNGTPETMEALMQSMEYEQYNDGEFYPQISYDCDRNLISIDTDSRGLFSIVYEERSENGKLDTFALDYLNKADFDTLASHSWEF